MKDPGRSMISVGDWTRGRISRTSSCDVRAIRFFMVPGEAESRSHAPHHSLKSGSRAAITGAAFSAFSPVPQRARSGSVKSRSRVSAFSQVHS